MRAFGVVSSLRKVLPLNPDPNRDPVLANPMRRQILQVTRTRRVPLLLFHRCPHHLIRAATRRELRNRDRNGSEQSETSMCREQKTITTAHPTEENASRYVEVNDRGREREERRKKRK